MVYFARHGESQANVDNIFAGPRYQNASLTAKGREQARDAARLFIEQGNHVDRIIASPLERAHDTAQIMATELGIDPDAIQYDSRLIEYDMGALSGQSMIGVTPQQRVEAAGAQDPQEFTDKILAAVEDARKLPGNTLIVSHNGVRRAIEAHKLGMTAERFYELDGYPNATIVPIA